jgi:hypothetical protein
MKNGWSSSPQSRSSSGSVENDRLIAEELFHLTGAM